MKRVAVILSGCGVFDGSEIHEAVLTLYFLDKAGADVRCFAPDKEQMHVYDHRAQRSIDGQSRNVLTESARIARGEIQALSELDLDVLDAIVLPGGFGAAKNLCTFATDGPDCTIDDAVAAVIRGAVDKGKVVGAICIAPAVVARALQDTNVAPLLTVGTDAGAQEALQAMGARTVSAPVDGVVVDEQYKIVTSPAYMLAGGIAELASGIEPFVDKVLALCDA